MVVFIVFLLVISGIIVFSLAAGAVFFRQIFIRKTDDGSLDSSVIHSSLKQIEQAVNGIDLPGIKMAGTGTAASHLNDRKIMIPLLRAKLRWLHYNEKESAGVPAGSGNVNGSGKNGEMDSVCAADGDTGVFYCRETLHITGSRNTRLTGYLCSVPPETGSGSTVSGADWDAGQTQKSYGTPYHDCTVILVHGYTDSAAGMAYLAEEYLKRGITVLAVDCRGHGYSGGKYITMGWTDARDIARWIQFLLQRSGGKSRIILHGVSMGAATVIQTVVLKRIQPVVSHIMAVVADCSFSSASAQIRHQARLLFGKRPVQHFTGNLIVAGLSAVNLFVNGFLLCQDSPRAALYRRQRLPAAQVPLILFHGGRDAFVPDGMASELVKAAGGYLVTEHRVSDAPHIGCYFYEPDIYMKTILDVLCT